MGARISKRSKDAIIDRVDVAQIVGETVQLKRSGPSLVGLCPFHAEKTPSFHVNKSMKVFHCHGCGAGGDIISFVRELHGFSYRESLEYLAERSGVDIEWEQADPRQVALQKEQRSQRRRLLDLNEAAQRFFVQQLHGPAGQVAREYLEKRGLSRETAERFGLGCAPDSWDALSNHLSAKGFTSAELQMVGLASPRRNGRGLYDRFRNRLMFPVRTTAGGLVAFGGRSLGADPRAAKYMNSPECELSDVETEFNHKLTHFYKKGQLVFGLWHARAGIKTRKQAIVVEGNLDVMMLHQVGLTNAVCFMGTAVTPAQIKEVSRFTDKVALVFDGDAAGRKAAKKVVPMCIEVGMGGVFANLPDGDDPDSYVRTAGVDAFERLLERAEPLVYGYIDAAVAAHDGTLLGKRKAISDVNDVLSKMANRVDSDMARTHLARGLSIEPSDLDRYLRHLGKPKRQPAADTTQTQDIEEPPISALELDLVRVLAANPNFLSYVVDQSCTDDVDHAGLREAIIMLVSRIREDDPDRIITTTDLRAGLSGLPDGRARRAFLRAMIESNLMESESAEDALQLILDRLEARALQPQLDRFTREIAAAAKDPRRVAELPELAAKQREISTRIFELQKAMKAAANQAAKRL